MLSRQEQAHHEANQDQASSSIHNLQRQSAYGLQRAIASRHSASKEPTKATLRRSGSSSLSNKKQTTSSSGVVLGTALRDRDMNQQADQAQAATSVGMKAVIKNSGKKREFAKPLLDKLGSVKNASSDDLQVSHSMAYQQNRLSVAPLGGPIGKSPSAASLQSSGGKQTTPQISALGRTFNRQSVPNQQQTSVVVVQGAFGAGSSKKSAQKSVGRYEIDNDSITEEEHDGSSFFMADHQSDHNQAGATEDLQQIDATAYISQPATQQLLGRTSTAESAIVPPSPISTSNWIGAGLVSRHDGQHHPAFCPGSAFQTPKPLRDEMQAQLGTDDFSSQQSPALSSAHGFKAVPYYNNDVQVVEQTPKRYQQLQNTNKTNMTAKRVTQSGYISYEKDKLVSLGLSNQSPMRLPPTQTATVRAVDKENSEASQQQHLYLAASNQHHQRRQSSGKKRMNNRYATNCYSSSQTTIEHLSGLALNVRKQVSPEREFSPERETQSPEQQIVQVDHQTQSPELSQSLHQPQPMLESHFSPDTAAYQPVAPDNAQVQQIVVRADARHHASIAENSYDHDHGTRLMSDYSPESPQQHGSSSLYSNGAGLNPYSTSTEISSKRTYSLSHQPGISPAEIQIQPVQVHQNASTTTFHEQQKSTDNSVKELVEKSPVKQTTSNEAGKEGILAALQINTITEESPDAGNPAVAQSIYENLKAMKERGFDVQDVDQSGCKDHLMDDMCATISASDISVQVEPAQPRPKSSSGVPNQQRRRRDQRKTPQGGRSSALKEQLITQAKRTKYTGGSKQQNTQAAESRQRSSSASRQSLRASTAASRSQSRAAPAMTTNSSTMSLQEQRRLANLLKARQYGNRQSVLNKSVNGARDQAKQQLDKTNGSGAGHESSPCEQEQQLSPVKPTARNENDHLSSSQTKDCSARKPTSQSRPKSRSKSTQRTKRQESKPMSQTATKAKIAWLQKHNAAKRIQRAYRGMVGRRQQAQREAQIAYVNEAAYRIQRAMRTFKCRQGFAKAVEKRQRLKMIVTDLGRAWRTRRSLNCLGTEVQEFVNCEDEALRGTLRATFHTLFTKVVRQKLYLESNFDKLQHVRRQGAIKAQQRTRQKQYQQRQAQKSHQSQHQRRDQRPTTYTTNPNGSPFKRSPEKRTTRQIQSIQSPDGKAKTRATAQAGGNQANSTFALHSMHMSQERRAPSKTGKSQQPCGTGHQQTSHRLINYGQQHNYASAAQTLNRNSSSKVRITNRNSTGSIGSGRDDTVRNGPMNEQVFVAVRNSFDNNAISELRNFIQNSGKKGEQQSYCSIQMTTSAFKEGARQRSSTKKQRFESAGAAEVTSSSPAKKPRQNSQVIVQVHNGAQPEPFTSTFQNHAAALASPSESAANLGSGVKRAHPRVMQSNSSAKQPINIQIGSGLQSQPVSRFSQYKTDAQIDQIAPYSDKKAAVIQEEEPPMTQQRRFERRQSAEQCGSEYRQNLKKVRPRVDCWNRSASRGDLGTPSQQLPAQRNILRSIEPYQGDESLGQGSVSAPRLGNQASRTVGSFNNQVTRAGQQSSVNKPQQAEQRGHQSNGVGVARSKSSNQVVITKETQGHTIKRQPSMLREPTKFPASGVPAATNAGVQVRRINMANTVAQAQPANRAVTPNATVSSRLERLAQPKHLRQAQQQKQQAHDQDPAGSNLKSFINQGSGQVAGGVGAVLGSKTAVAQPSSGLTARGQTAQVPSMQTQVFEMRENMANLTQLMESIAQEADTNQKNRLDTSKPFGMNSQYRATMKAIQAQEKSFQQLMGSLEAQFARFRDQAVPQHPSQNADLC